MERSKLTIGIAFLVVTSLVLVGAVGVVVAHQHKDGNLGNGEELKSGQDDENPQFPTNYTAIPDNHQPGFQNGAMNHFSQGGTENGTLHWIVIQSPHFDFSDCSSENTRAFGIDRGNDDPGTKTDESLLNSYKDSTYTSDMIALQFYKKNELGGQPVNASVYDEIVARQENCYDNPKQKGWYRLNGYINGSTTGDAQTDYNITDYSKWVWICDCQNRQEAINTLGPPPAETHVAYRAEGGSGGGGGNGGAGGGGGNGGGSTPTATDASGGSGTGNGGGTTTGTAAATGTGTGAGNGTGTNTAMGTGTQTTGGGEAAGGGAGTPTEGGGPGLGVVSALVALAGAAHLAHRRG